MTWRVEWPDSPRHGVDEAETAAELIELIRSQQFVEYDSTEEFTMALVGRVNMWSGHAVEHTSDPEELLKRIARTNTITLYIHGERYHA